MTEDGRPWVSQVVRITRLQMAQDPSLDYEYLPPMGSRCFIQASLELLFGKHNPALVENRVRTKRPDMGEGRGVVPGRRGLRKSTA